ncbi:putative DNA-binding domain-containing protein [Pseudomonas sp. 148P]|uniref:DNA-binding domain-containing protein n=1 Tax=Pseudomonas ulcerans TaxID=3115852 RepID=A0ABU7HSF0_9PSED|nr:MULTISPECIES: putative DNA-binding domain-containing protein [unclassified Pseudomonas]MEE1923439.1 putative DNA-binding domain-containing protein [Pseudomonas sp. 147P]MEE1934411.1 putative DNA-binding domain-containing protein [Pseudomonas sp. 148P]
MDEALREQQLRMTRFIRDPQSNPPPPGIEARRLAVYRQLFLGNVQGLLAGSFPVLRATLADKPWQALVEDFYARHRCRTPLFTEVAGEWVDYLEKREDLPGWMAELAHYEWIETVLLLSDSADPAHDPEGDLLDGVPLLSSLAMPLAYAWPVSHLGPGQVPTEAPTEPTLLLARRGADQKVHFSRLAPLAYLLLMSLREQHISGRAHLQALAERTGLKSAVLEREGIALLYDLKVQGVVPGTCLY